MGFDEKDGGIVKKIIIGIFIVFILFSGCELKVEASKEYEGFGVEEKYDSDEELEEKEVPQYVEVTSLFDGTKYIFEDVIEVTPYSIAFKVETENGDAWFLAKDYTCFTTEEGVKFLTIKE